MKGINDDDERSSNCMRASFMNDPPEGTNGIFVIMSLKGVGSARPCATEIDVRFSRRRRIADIILCELDAITFGGADVSAVYDCLHSFPNICQLPRRRGHSNKGGA